MKSKESSPDTGSKRTADDIIRMVRSGERLTVAFCYPFDGDEGNRAKAWELVSKLNDIFPNLNGFNFSSMVRYRRHKHGKWLLDLDLNTLVTAVKAMGECDAIFIAGNWMHSLECFIGCVSGQFNGIPVIEMKDVMGYGQGAIEFREIHLPGEMPKV